jgi:DNA-binding MarR family transcriptional regulator
MTPDGSDRAVDRSALVAHALDTYEALMAVLTSEHRPDFLEIGITMPQAKILYLLAATGELHLSELVTTLGVSLSTVSGIVDRLVEQGLVARRDDPADRRQVMVAPTATGSSLVERFRELNRGQLQRLLELLADDELRTVDLAMAALVGAVARRAAPSSATSAPAATT